jgi:Flp pilus assembly protein TadB
MDQQQLTFSALEQRIEKISEHPSYRMAPSRRSRWGNGIGMLAGLSGLILVKVLPTSPTLLVTAIVLLVVEVAAFAVALVAELPTLNLRPSSERREYAETLDHDMPHHMELIDWIGGFPQERLKAMSAFASHRLDRFRNKLPLLTGSLEKLGFLPLATALFLQFNDMRWPPHLSWPEIILIGALMLVYWTSMLQVGLRFRLELYDTLLKRALADRQA